MPPSTMPPASKIDFASGAKHGKCPSPNWPEPPISNPALSPISKRAAANLPSTIFMRSRKPCPVSADFLLGESTATTAFRDEEKLDGQRSRLHPEHHRHHGEQEEGVVPMPAFRLKMATQRGEQIAAEFGFGQFPVKPRDIARAAGSRSSRSRRHEGCFRSDHTRGRLRHHHLLDRTCQRRFREFLDQPRAGALVPGGSSRGNPEGRRDTHVACRLHPRHFLNRA